MHAWVVLLYVGPLDPYTGDTFFSLELYVCVTWRSFKYEKYLLSLKTAFLSLDRLFESDLDLEAYLTYFTIPNNS